MPALGFGLIAPAPWRDGRKLRALREFRCVGRVNRT